MYGSTVYRFDVGKYGAFDYHQWNHPCEEKKHLTIDVVEYFARFTKYGPIAIDIGAHTGDSTLPIAAAGFKRTIAFEPNSHVFEILKANSIDNPHLNIIPVCAAIMEKAGEYTFQYSSSFCNGGYEDTEGEFHTSSGEGLKVVGTNILSFLENEGIAIEDLGFIKIDTEGHDRHVLESLMSVKDRLQAAIQVEVYGGLNREGVKKLEKTIDRLGYKSYTANELTPVRSCIESKIWPNGIATDLILLR